MALRKIAEFKNPETEQRATVYRDTEWQEYRVQFYTANGEYRENADYHTDDKQDAFVTAQYQIGMGI